MSDERGSMQKPYVPYGSREFYVRKLADLLDELPKTPETFHALLERLANIWEQEDRESILRSVERSAAPADPSSWSYFPPPIQRKLPTDLQASLHAQLRQLAITADSLPPKCRDRADRCIARLSRLLDPELAWQIVKSWFDDHRAFRRNIAVRVLTEGGVPEDFEHRVLSHYRKDYDTRLLKLISLNPGVAALLNEGDLIAALAIPLREIKIGEHTLRDRDGRYWQMRAFQAQFIGGRDIALPVALKFPAQFAWAVDRQRHRRSVSTLRTVLQANRDNPEVVWSCTRAMIATADPDDIAWSLSVASDLLRRERERLPVQY